MPSRASFRLRFPRILRASPTRDSEMAKAINVRPAEGLILIPLSPFAVAMRAPVTTTSARRALSISSSSRDPRSLAANATSRMPPAMLIMAVAIRASAPPVLRSLAMPDIVLISATTAPVTTPMATPALVTPSAGIVASSHIDAARMAMAAATVRSALALIRLAVASRVFPREPRSSSKAPIGALTPLKASASL